MHVCFVAQDHFASLTGTSYSRWRLGTSRDETAALNACTLLQMQRLHCYKSEGLRAAMDGREIDTLQVYCSERFSTACIPVAYENDQGKVMSRRHKRFTCASCPACKTLR
jgi:hypothetical protein